MWCILHQWFVQYHPHLLFHHLPDGYECHILPIFPENPGKNERFHGSLPPVSMIYYGLWWTKLRFYRALPHRPYRRYSSPEHPAHFLSRPRHHLFLYTTDMPDWTSYLPCRHACCCRTAPHPLSSPAKSYKMPSSITLCPDVQ